MISFVVRSLWLSVRIFPNVLLLYAILGAFFYVVFIISGREFGSIVFLSALIGWFIILLMQIALIREGLEKLGVTDAPDLDGYITAILNALLLSLIQAFLAIILSWFYFGILFKATGLTQGYVDAFGYDYVINKIIEDNLIVQTAAILALITLVFGILRTTLAAFLTVPLAAQAAMVGDGKRRGLMYGVAMKFYKIGVTWIIGNIVFLLVLGALFIALNFSVVTTITTGLAEQPIGSIEGYEESFNYYLSLIDFSSLEALEIWILLAAMIVMFMWWTSMWASSAALGFSEYERESRSHNKAVIDSLRHDGNTGVSAKELWKSRE